MAARAPPWRWVMLVAALCAGCATAPPPGPAGFLGLQGVVLGAADESVATWYGRLFESPADMQALGFPGFAVGTAELGFDAPAVSGVIAFWRVASIDAAFDRLIALGAEPVTGIQEIGAARIAIVRDPFGNLIGLSQAPEAGVPAD